jgi:nicotinate-nucleotide adenylyltransferase
VGIFGGSFDPVHNGHLRLAEEAADALGLTQVRWVPSGKPGHRDAAIASAQDRLALLRLALADNERFVLDDGEFRIAEATYTVNTLLRIRGEVGDKRPLVLLIGADQFLVLPTWREWTRLFDLAHIGVAERPGHVIDPARLPPDLAAELTRRGLKYHGRNGAGAAGPNAVGTEPARRILRFPLTALDISSTAIRAAIAAGRSARYLLPETVFDYIQAGGLYGNKTRGQP